MDNIKFHFVLGQLERAVSADLPGYLVSVEHPGCLMIILPAGVGEVWCGTVNGPWGADFKGPDEEVIATFESAIPGDTEDVQPIVDWVLAAHLAATIINEVGEAAEEDPRFLDAESFAELHDLCDANMLGESDAYMDRFGQENHMERAIPIINEAQGLVDQWLKSEAVRRSGRA